MDDLLDVLKKKSRKTSPMVVALALGVSLLIVLSVVGFSWYRVNSKSAQNNGEEVATFSKEASSTAKSKDATSQADSPNTIDDNGIEASPDQERSSQTISVYISGHVTSPGVYSLTSNSRIADALASAGGASRGADLLALNLAAHIVDGQQIYVPSKKEVAKAGFNPLAMTVTGVGSSSAATGENATSSSGLPVPATSSLQGGNGSGKTDTSKMQAKTGTKRININTASAQELELLSGVGPATAQKILLDRTTNGPFVSPEDIMRVSGIGEKKFEALKSSISVK